MYEQLLKDFPLVVPAKRRQALLHRTVSSELATAITDYCRISVVHWTTVGPVDASDIDVSEYSIQHEFILVRLLSC